MADVQPLRALHYDQAVAGPLQDLVAPPYDVIDPPARAALQARSPHNVVAIDLPQGDDPTPPPPRRCGRGWTRAPSCATPSPRIWALVQDYTGARRPQAHPQGLPRARPRGGLRPGPDPPARAHAPGPEGGPAAPHARDAREPLADLLALQRSGRRRVGRAGAAHRRRAVGRGDRRGRHDPPAAPGHRRRRPGRRSTTRWPTPSCSSPTATTATRPRACTRTRSAARAITATCSCASSRSRTRA